MRRSTAILLAVAVVGGVAVTVTFISKKSERTTNTAREKDEFNRILDALIFFSPDGQLKEPRHEGLAGRLKAQHEAVEKLQQLGTNALPRLMEEVRAVGRLETINRSAAADGTRQIARAFEILGGDAAPLLPLLIDELHTGRSVGPSIVGIAGIGGTDAGLALVPWLTNSDPTIRNWTMSALSRFSTNHVVGLAAVDPLSRILEDDSEYSRALAASVLGSLGQAPDTVIPRLLRAAKSDSDFVVRVMAIKAIGRFGTSAASVKPDLDRIAKSDSEASVRRIASVALQAANGEIPPDEVQ